MFPVDCPLNHYWILLVGGFKGVLSQENGTVMEIDSTFGRLKTSQTSPQRIPKTGNWSPKISTDRDIFSQTQPIVCVWSIARRWNMMEQAEWSAWECDWSENKICTLFSYRPTGLFGCNAKYSSKFYAAARPIPSQSRALQKPRPPYHPTDIDACSLGSLSTPSADLPAVTDALQNRPLINDDNWLSIFFQQKNVLIS